MTAKVYSIGHISRKTADMMAYDYEMINIDQGKSGKGKPAYDQVLAWKGSRKKNIKVCQYPDFKSIGNHGKPDWVRSGGNKRKGTKWIIIFSIFALVFSPIILMGYNVIKGSGIEVLGVESPQLSLVALASAWVSVLVVSSYQALARSVVTWKLFGSGVKISHIASVVDSASERDFFSWSTVIVLIPTLIGAGANVIAARCFKVWIPGGSECVRTVPAGGFDMYLLIALLVVSFFIEVISVAIVAMPITARHLMEWSNESTRTGASGSHPGWSHRVRLVAVYGKETKYAQLEFQDKFGSHKVDDNRTWTEISASDANDEADTFYGARALKNNISNA
ncbi:hypothetical protein BGZ76_009946 [Entomortierella beljakovae]|nr:hypothetical protein BGZ76_009946 [Entomortierella beljakovae]